MGFLLGLSRLACYYNLRRVLLYRQSLVNDCKPLTNVRSIRQKLGSLPPSSFNTRNIRPIFPSSLLPKTPPRVLILYHSFIGCFYTTSFWGLPAFRSSSWKLNAFQCIFNYFWMFLALFFSFWHNRSKSAPKDIVN